MSRGLFISFESIDGVGKSTQIQLLAEHLRNYGVDVHLTKEPGDKHLGSCIGADIRNVLFYGIGTKSLHPGVADLLFVADHLQNAGDVARWVAEGKTVLCDRYADSQFAYAAAEGKRCPEWALDLYRQQFGIVPDVTILLVARGPVSQAAPYPEDISWALTRAQNRHGEEKGKQNGKGWNDVEQQRCIQEAYITNLGELQRTVQVWVWEHDSIDDVRLRIQSALFHRLQSLYATEPGVSEIECLF